MKKSKSTNQRYQLVLVEKKDLSKGTPDVYAIFDNGKKLSDTVLSNNIPKGYGKVKNIFFKSRKRYENELNYKNAEFFTKYLNEKHNELEQLKKERDDYKHNMFLCKPLRGFMGNQYPYWESKYQETVTKIKNFKK